ncbi:hypothetical protein DRQ50_01650 [bacterium]|nr:MAG: hypothetical protein DRQ50_01650 [bacterium]
MTIIATAMNAIFDLLTAPFGSHASLAVCVLSILTGVAMLLLFKVTTNQDQLVAAREVLTGRLYEMGLFQDHLGVLMKIQGDLALANLRYVRWSLPALAAMLLPMLLILAQFDARYGHQPMVPGEVTLLRVALAAGQWSLLDKLELTADTGVEVDSRPVLDPGTGVAVWRVRAELPGDHELVVRLPGGTELTKELVVGEGAPRLARVREQESLLRVLLNPAEAPLPGDQPVIAITLELPSRRLDYAGLRVHWLWAMIVFSMAFGLAVKDVLKVRL